ncbi:MAG: alpha/beta fold hydrolase, partial [Microthrixaceae bacterium]
GLAQLRVPTMVLHGDRDPLVNISGGRRTAELVPGAELRVLKGMGHDMPPGYWDRIIAGVTDVAVAASA